MSSTTTKTKKKKGIKRPRPTSKPPLLPSQPPSPSPSPSPPKKLKPRKPKKPNARHIPDANWKKLLKSGKMKTKSGHNPHHQQQQQQRRKTLEDASKANRSEDAPSTGWSKSGAEMSEKIWANAAEKQSTRVVALDCEMVGVGSDMKSRLARVCVVTEEGKVMLDKFCRPAERITDFRTRWSGIRAVDLLNAPPVSAVQQEVADLIRGKVVVGHALKHDFEVLLYKHKLSLIRDTASYRPLQKKKADGSGRLRKAKLRDLALQELQWVIQEGEHDPFIDARAALEIYKKHRDEWERWLKDKRQSRQSRRASNKRKRHQHEESMQRQLHQSTDIFARKR